MDSTTHNQLEAVLREWEGLRDVALERGVDWEAFLAALRRDDYSVSDPPLAETFATFGLLQWLDSAVARNDWRIAQSPASTAPPGNHRGPLPSKEVTQLGNEVRAKIVDEEARPRSKTSDPTPRARADA